MTIATGCDHTDGQVAAEEHRLELLVLGMKHAGVDDQAKEQARLALAAMREPAACEAIVRIGPVGCTAHLHCVHPG